MADRSIEHILDLDPRIQTPAIVLLTTWRNAGLPLVITSGRRGLIEQVGHVIRGRSWTLQSKHLEGLAFDVDIWGVPPDDVPLVYWRAIADVAMRLGLQWGGAYQDYRHFNL